MSVFCFFPVKMTSFSDHFEACGFQKWKFFFRCFKEFSRKKGLAHIVRYIFSLRKTHILMHIDAAPHESSALPRQKSKHIVENFILKKFPGQNNFFQPFSRMFLLFKTVLLNRIFSFPFLFHNDIRKIDFFLSSWSLFNRWCEFST